MPKYIKNVWLIRNAKNSNQISQVMHNATLLSDCSIDYVLSCKMPQVQIGM